MEIRELIISAIRQQFPKFGGEISDRTSAKDIPGWDSVAHVQLMLLIEQLSGREVEIGRTFDISDVGGLIRFVETLATTIEPPLQKGALKGPFRD